MKLRAWFGVAVLLLVIGSACTANGPLVRGSTSHSASAASPTPVPSQQPSPPEAPSPIPGAIFVACQMIPSAASAPLVITLTPNRDHILLDSLRDPANPGTICTLGGGTFRIITATEIGYVTTSSSNDPINDTSTIGRISLTDLHHPVIVAKVQGDVMDVAWSPDGSSVAYLLYTANPGLGSGAANQLWLKIGDAQPRALTRLIPLFGRGGSISDQTIVRFSHDGNYVLMVDTFVNGPTPASLEQVHFQVR